MSRSNDESEKEADKEDDSENQSRQANVEGAQGIVISHFELTQCSSRLAIASHVGKQAPEIAEPRTETVSRIPASTSILDPFNVCLKRTRRSQAEE